eukprot:3330764-Karenia_brevis.AAC.1
MLLHEDLAVLMHVIACPAQSQDINWEDLFTPRDREIQLAHQLQDNRSSYSCMHVVVISMIHFSRAAAPVAAVAADNDDDVDE